VQLKLYATCPVPFSKATSPPQIVCFYLAYWKLLQVALLSQRARAMLRLCLSLVSFNSTKRRTQSFIASYVYLSLRTIKCCSVVFGVTLRLLVINISSSYPAINKLRRLLSAISVTIITRGQSNLTKSASRGAHSPVRGHPQGIESCTIEFLG